MRKKNYKHFPFLIILLITTALSIISCNNTNKNIFEFKQEFTDNNWNYEQRILEFEKEIEASENPYEIALTLELTDKLMIERLPFTLSVYGPDGSESHKPTIIVFNVPNNPETEHISGPKTFHKVIYDKKYFNKSGVYKLRLLQKSGKYDLQNVKSITITATPTTAPQQTQL